MRDDATRGHRLRGDWASLAVIDRAGARTATARCSPARSRATTPRWCLQVTAEPWCLPTCWWPDRHFRLDSSTPRDVGRKAVAQNAADIEAMGGRTPASVVALQCAR